jgi:hypothetical protein
MLRGPQSGRLDDWVLEDGLLRFRPVVNPGRSRSHARRPRNSHLTLPEAHLSRVYLYLSTKSKIWPFQLPECIVQKREKLSGANLEDLRQHLLDLIGDLAGVSAGQRS